LVGDAFFFTFYVAILWRIICFMQDEINGPGDSPHGALEFRKGCPVCEHSDPDLERELLAFAQLLFDIYLADREKSGKNNRSAGIDNRP
jgi:hypothetical protein